MKKFLVNEDNVGLRLDAFLKKNDDQDKSRVYYQNTIDECKVKVNSKIVESLKGDKVIIGKHKRRKDYRRKTGHRHKYHKITIEDIIV